MFKTSPIAQAREFATAATTDGWEYAVRGNIITIKKHFTPGDMNAFQNCDMTAYRILSLAPLRGGSVWGTDGGSVGGHSAIKQGCYILNKSGKASRFLTELTRSKLR